MTLLRSCLPLLAAALFSVDLSGQFLPGHPSFSNRGRRVASDSVRYLPRPIYRWRFSFNPLSLIEPQPAVGIGVGYRLNKNMEIWSETSLITEKMWWSIDTNQLKGIREILQLKYFYGQNRQYFFAGELRYKSYSMNSSDYLYNATTGNGLSTLQPYHFSAYFFGAALQFGARLRSVRRSPRWWVEGTAGIGVKLKTVILSGLPAGFNLTYPTDPSIIRFETTGGTLPYFPGSVRFVYTFGKKLR